MRSNAARHAIFDRDERAYELPNALSHPPRPRFGWARCRPAPLLGGIPECLRAGGASVHLAGIGGFATIEENARRLDARIGEILAATGADRVNIVAHSMGGLDSRRCISSLGGGRRVACLCTFNTPHRGTALADLFLEVLPRASRPIAALVDFYSRAAHGEDDAEALEAARELSRSACAAFNEANPDDPEVYYRSYASRIDGTFPVRRKAALWKLLYEREGENDGLVSVESARWGDFKGVVGAEAGLSISHDDLHDLRKFRSAPPFDAPAFFAEVVADLALSGY